MAGAVKLSFADLEPVGPGTPSGRYLRRFWHPIARDADLKPGYAKPVELLGERFTLYRGAGGEAHLTQFRCPHRGTQLSLGWVEEDGLRCRYHGWKFNALGRCIEQPDEDRPFADKVRLKTYPAREYVGLVFAFIGDGAPPEFPRYPDLDQDGVITTDPVEIVPCGFWNRLDNDIAHIPWVHRATALTYGRNDFLVPRRERVEETEYGWKSTRFAKGGGNGLRDTSGSAHFFMPNVYQFGVRTRARGFEGRNLWDTKVTWTVPLNDTVFAAFDVTHTPLKGAEADAYRASRLGTIEDESGDRWDLAEKILAGEMRIEDLPGDLSAYTRFAIEDYVTQVGQGPVAGRGDEMLGNNDGKLVLLRRLWLREIAALLEDRPLTGWKIPPQPLQVMETA